MPRHVPVIIAVCVVASLLALRAHRATATAEPHVTAEIRTSTLTFAPDVAPGDRAWVLAAIATARPEAQRLIAEVDGMVEVKTDLNGPGSPYPPGSEQAIGLAEMVGDRAVVALDVRELDGERAIDRNMVVLHELGHVVDAVLVTPDLGARLDAQIPASYGCDPQQPDVGCAPREERFAETFAKWCTGDIGFNLPIGYKVAPPGSLDEWGAQLVSGIAAAA